ncbi:MAG: AMP-binding protein [Saprospiraceae bacterium]|nr:AMP-binding protein [Saprospiraceae bacterium]
MKLLKNTIGALLERNSQIWEAEEAAVFCESNTRWTWGELNQQVNAVAKGFMALGVRKNDHIAIWATNVPEWLLTQLAAARLGAVLVTLNPEWKHSELEYALVQSDANVMVMIPGFQKTVRGKVFDYNYTRIFKELCPSLPCLDKFPELRQVVVTSDETVDGLINWKQFIERGNRISDNALDEAAAQVAPTDTAVIQYTSGTTGFPKGTMLSHYNIVNNALAVSEHMGLDTTDRLCAPVPFYHCFGSILANLGCLVSGATEVVPAAMFNSHRTLEAIQNEHCTVLYGVPTMFISELEEIDFDRFDLHTLRTGIMAGAPVDKELFEAVTQKMGAKQMTIAYGLTEASPVTHQTVVTDPVEKRITSVGRPIEHTEARIVDPITLTTLPPGKVGEIWVKGFHVMQGYYKNPEETAKAIVEDGWLRSGDLGVMDENGFYRIVGRLKEMLIVGGHNVYPAEVEQSLHSLLDDKVEIVQVVAVPHYKLQEVVGLAVKCLPGKTLTLREVQERCEGNLEWSKIPRHLMVLDDFSKAMTVTGKIQKFKLAEMFQEMEQAVIA